MKRILIADHDHNVTFTLKKVLQAESYEVKSCNDSDLLLQLAGSQNFDLIIVNSKIKTANGDDPIPSLQITQPSAAFMVLSDEDDTEGKSIPRVFDQIRKPIDFRHIINRIKELFNGGGFSGIISGINLADYVQMLCMNRITKAILIRKNRQQGIVLLQDGVVVYAGTAELKGEEAFYEILSWREGQIKEVKVKKFPLPNINKDIQQLLLHASLSIDESAAEKADDDELFGTEIIAALPEPGETTNGAAEEDGPPLAGPEDVPPGRFLRRHRIKSAAILALLFIGMIIAGQNFFRNEVEAEKSSPYTVIRTMFPGPPSPGTTAEKKTSGEPPAPTPPADRATTATAALSATAPAAADAVPAAGKASERAEAGKADASRSNHTINVSGLAAVEGNVGKQEFYLRLHGSNTIGAKLAPALVIAYLQDKLHATGITTAPGKRENEEIISARLNGKPIAVEIQAHGSATAFQDLKAGSCDIGDASRKIKDKEVKDLLFLGDMTGISNEHVIGLDGIAVLVNKSNPVKQISTETLQAIFSGKISDWKQINGRDAKINVYSRDDKSGTYDTFKSIILGDEHPLTPTAKRYESNASLSDDVSRDPSGIGFTGLPYVRSSKALAVSEPGARPIYPNFFTVATEDYPISRRLFMYTAAVPKNPHVAPFINFVLSEDGQKVAEKADFIDMNIRSFFMDPAGDADHAASTPRLRPYLHAVNGARRLSLNFRFRTGRAILDNRSVRDMDRIITFLADKLNKRVILAGYADNSGNYEFNYQLAMARALLVSSELKARGIAVNEVFSCGQEMPVASNLTALGREKNRRVEVWLK